MKRFMFFALVLPCAFAAFAEGVTLSDTEAATPTTNASAEAVTPTTNTPTVAASASAVTPTVNTPAVALSPAIKPIEPLLSPIVVDTLPTENPDLKVVLFNDKQGLSEIANILGTIPYEVLTSFSSRVRRVYYRE